jgi:hypothetical protein
MIYIKSFIKIGSGIQKFLKGDAHTNTERTEVGWTPEPAWTTWRREYS